MLSSTASPCSWWLENSCPFGKLLSNYFSLSGLFPKPQYSTLRNPKSCWKGGSVCAGARREYGSGCAKSSNGIRSSVSWTSAWLDAVLRGRSQFLSRNRHSSGPVAYSLNPFQGIPGVAIWHWKYSPCTCSGTWSWGEHHQCIFQITVHPTTAAGKSGGGTSAAKTTQLSWDSIV